MIKKYLAFFILIGLLFLTYKKFETYDPKIVEQNQEVKGSSSKKEIIPYPKNSIVTSETYTEKYDQVTLKTPLDYKKIREFYKNILLESDWILKAEETNDTFNTLKFKRGDTITKIISTINKEEENTTVSIEIIRD